jgi:hypothetical protein
VSSLAGLTSFRGNNLVIIEGSRKPFSYYLALKFQDSDGLSGRFSSQITLYIAEK